MEQPSTKGFSPEQIATGALENGKEVVILYIKEFNEQLNRVRKAGNIGYFYNWSYLKESDSYVLFIYWHNDEEIAVVFTPKQRAIVEALKSPKELIVTSIPINLLVKNAQQESKDFFELDGPVVYLNDVVYKEPNGLEN